MSCAERGVVDRCDERGGARQLAHQGPLERLALTCDALPRAQGAPIAPIRPQATSPAQARPGGGAVWGAPPPQRHPQPAVLSRSPEPTHTTAPAGAIPAPIQGTCHFYDLVWSPRPAAACLWAASGSSASQASRSELTRLGIFSLTCGDLSSSARGGARCALAVRGCGRGRRLWRGGGSTRAAVAAWPRAAARRSADPRQLRRAGACESRAARAARGGAGRRAVRRAWDWQCAGGADSGARVRGRRRC